MIYQIADLKVNIPDLYDMEERAKDYLTSPDGPIDISISKDKSQSDRFTALSPDRNLYLDYGEQFYKELINFDGMMLHASCVKYEGYCYLFSGACGVGKSTHTALWKKHFGASIINDDKPAIRRIEGKWLAYGTPWCGKDGINLNDKGEIKGICFIKRGEKIGIRELEPTEAIEYFLGQTIRTFDLEKTSKLIELLADLIKEIPMYELISSKSKRAAELSRDMMVK